MSIYENVKKACSEADISIYALEKKLNFPRKIATMFIDLTEEEEHAILMHNGLYGSLYKEIKGYETELYMLVHFADMWASRVVEK